MAYLQSCGRNHRLCSQEQEFKMSGKETSYGTIFKTTFLFGFVQVFRIIVGVVKNKIVAILLGAEGIGLLGIYTSTIALIQQGAGLGISQSGVRDVADAKGKGDETQFSKIINVINKTVIFTGLLGCLTTLMLSKYLSKWTLGNTEHIIAYCILSFAVLCNIINDGKQAILKGARQMRALANASVIGVSIGFLTAIPLYYFFGKSGIVPELLISSISAYLISNFYVSRIRYDKYSLSIRKAISLSKNTIVAGGALMLSNFLAYVANIIILAYIRKEGGLVEVGIYNAGTTIMTTYFGVIITALSTDYFPRISALWDNNTAIEEELNKQSVVSLILCCPLFVIFITLMPLFIRALYTEEFLPAVDFIKFGVIGTIITIVSNQVDMILVAKYKVKIFFLIAILYRLFQVAINIVLYNSYHLEGTGISLAIMALVHLSVMMFIVYKLYKIKFNSFFLKLSSIICCFLVISLLTLNMEHSGSRYLLGAITSIVAVVFSFYICRKKLGIDIFSLIKIRR